MAKGFTPAQQRQNRAFLRLLTRTGNARAAAAALGIHRATLTRRRARHPAFAAEWDAALAVAHAALNSSRPAGERSGQGRGAPSTPADSRTPHLHRTPSGRVQLRRSAARRLTHEAEQAFLAALSATANVRLSAAAAGFSHSAFYARAKSSPAFAREMRLALQMGFDRIELALIESWRPDSHRDDGWRHNDPPPIPPMTANQALQLLDLHQKQARLLAEPAHIKRRKGESSDAHSFRLAEMYRAQVQRDRDAFDIAEAERRFRAATPPPVPEPAPTLPALDQVTGWSKARSGTPPHPARPTSASGVHHPDVALFGGWRLKDWKGRGR